MKNKRDDQNVDEQSHLEEATLMRLLAMPPDPKTKKADDANAPKKRGRPSASDKAKKEPRE
jgi:hypothetical protein